MKKNKYEISIWKDVHVNATRDDSGNVKIPSHFEEQKLIVIGSSNMTSQARALEPKLVENINGTSTLTFKMFYKYIDNETGEKIDNPYIKLLVNERKVKCFWKDKWYNLVVKGIQEDSSGKSITYTCKDQFINELSKTGFDLEFSNELMNNSGTIKELAERVVEGTDWKIASGDAVLQELEESVYEAENSGAFSALNQAGAIVEIPANSKILIYYSVLTEKKPYFQFYYSDGSFTTESATSMLVSNGKCYGIEGVNYGEIKNGSITITIDETEVTFTGVGEVSENYRAKRLVKQQKSEYVDIVGKYCSIYKDKNDNLYYGYEKTVLNDPTTIISTVANSGTNGFTSNEGWTLHEKEEVLAMPFGHYPLLDEESVSENNYPNSFLCLPQKGTTIVTATNSEGATKQYTDTHPYTYLNKGISLNSSYYEKGFTKGEIYIFRIKATLGRSAPYLYYAGEGTSTDTVTYYYYDLETGFYEKAEGSVKGYYRYDSKEIHYYKGDVSITQHDSAGKEYKRYFFHPVIGSYTTNKGYYDIEKYFELVDNKIEFTKDGWLEYRMECTKSISQKNLSSNFGLFLRVYRSGWIQEVQFFKEIKDDSENSKRLEPNTINSEGVVQAQYFLFSSAEIANKTEEEEIEYTWRGDSQSEVPTSYSPVYPNNNFEKIRSIEAKQSNRFNILQTLAETFECYPIFTITNKSTGDLKYENGIPEKTITFKQSYGQEVGFGFIYGIDLKTISRTINSDQIVTKTIVSQNSNSAGLNGFCTIARASENEAKASYILNLDYYVNQGLIKSGILNNDLYNSATAIGLYPELRKQNNLYDGYSEKLGGKETTLTRLERMLESYEGGYQGALETITKKVTEFKSYAGKQCSYKEAYNKVNSGELKNNSNAVECVSAWTNALTLRDAYSAQVESAKNVISELKSTIKDLKSKQENCKTAIKNVEQEFFLKYSTFIQEGSWISEDYMDDNLYYLDAKSVAYTSSRPQIQYNISVLRLSALEEFKGKDFKLGDITYIEDTEFFGYKEISTETGIFKVPYQELVTISEITSYFDTPENDSFKVQNYKTQFEDLFQRITATTQSLQYAEGEYKKAADAIDENGNIKATLLSQSLATNQNIIINYSNNQIVQDSTGITLWKKNDPQDQVKITAGGIIFTNNGGETWNTGIDASGVRADALTAGAINSEKIMIYSGSYPSFRWTSSGIEAFNFSETGVDFTTVVRFDQYGIYGIKNSSTTASEPWTPKNEDDIWNSANFGLTWKGFFLKNTGDSHRFEISSEDDFRIVKLSGEEEQELVKIGCLHPSYKEFIGESFVSGIVYYERINGEYVTTKDTMPSSEKKYYVYDTTAEVYGLRLTNDSGSITMETINNGELWLRDVLSIGYESDDYNVRIGNLGKEEESATVGLIFDANNVFKIYADGSSFIGGDATIGGTLSTADGASINGTLYATAGRFGSKDGDRVEISENGLTVIGAGLQIKNSDESKILLSYDNGALNIQGKGSFSGEIIAESGSFSGEINALSGNIGGFVISKDFLYSSKSYIEDYTETKDTEVVENKDYYVYDNDKGYTKISIESFSVGTAYYEKISRPSIILNGSDGSIYAENITLGNSAVIEDFLRVGILEDYENLICNPAGSNEGYFIKIHKINGGKNIELFSIKSNGDVNMGTIQVSSLESKMRIGQDTKQITIDGEASTIEGYNWNITPSIASFSQIAVTNGIFKTGDIQTLGGAMLFKPRGKCRIKGNRLLSVDDSEEANKWFCGQDGTWVIIDKDFQSFDSTKGTSKLLRVTRNEANECLLQTWEEFKKSFSSEQLDSEVVEQAEANELEDTTATENSYDEYTTITLFCNEEINKSYKEGKLLNSLMIGINSGDQAVSFYGQEFLMPQSFSFNKIEKELDDEGNFTEPRVLETPSLILGKLQESLGGGYGLYCDNVYLNGQIVSSSIIENKEMTTGINTSSSIISEYLDDESPIIFWGGAEDGNISEAKFQITQKGSLYANTGLFEGSILTKSILRGAKIYAAEIHGDEDLNGQLAIYNTRTESKTYPRYIISQDQTPDSGKIYYIQDANREYIIFTGESFSEGVIYYEKETVQEPLGGIYFKEEWDENAIHKERNTLLLSSTGFTTYAYNADNSLSGTVNFLTFTQDNGSPNVEALFSSLYSKKATLGDINFLEDSISIDSSKSLFLKTGTVTKAEISSSGVFSKSTLFVEKDAVFGGGAKEDGAYYKRVYSDEKTLGYDIYIY